METIHDSKYISLSLSLSLTFSNNFLLEKDNAPSFERRKVRIGEKGKSNAREGGVSSGIVIFARGGVEKKHKGRIYIYIYVDRGKGKWSRRTKSKKERGTHVRAQFNKRSVPFVPFLARYSPTRSPLLFHPPKPRPRLSPPHSYAEQNADEQPSSNAAHLVFWLRSEPARQISSSRDFYLILPPIQCSKQCSLLSPDRISSSLRRQPISSNIAARYS